MYERQMEAQNKLDKHQLLMVSRTGIWTYVIGVTNDVKKWRVMNVFVQKKKCTSNNSHF